MVKDLRDLDAAGTVLLAALNQLRTMNPLDYCLNALGSHLTVLPK